MNEFKFSALRQFGSENVSFTATIHSDKETLTSEQVQSQVDQITTVIDKSFRAAQEREFTEKELLAIASERRTAQVKKLDDALRAEMAEKQKAQQTIRDAEKASKKLK